MTKIADASLEEDEARVRKIGDGSGAISFALGAEHDKGGDVNHDTHTTWTSTVSSSEHDSSCHRLKKKSSGEKKISFIQKWYNLG